MGLTHRDLLVQGIKRRPKKRKKGKNSIYLFLVEKDRLILICPRVKQEFQSVITELVTKLTQANQLSQFLTSVELCGRDEYVLRTNHLLKAKCHTMLCFKSLVSIVAYDFNMFALSVPQSNLKTTCAI